MTDNISLDINAIMRLLPHRYPFLLVDRVLEYRKGESIRALKNVTYNEPFFPGHFPQRPVMPAPPDGAHVLSPAPLRPGGGQLWLRRVWQGHSGAGRRFGVGGGPGCRHGGYHPRNEKMGHHCVKEEIYDNHLFDPPR